MKKTFIALFLVIAPCFALFAQDKGNLTKVFLQDGTSISAYVEIQEEGGYKLTTEDGAILFFREGEISINKPFSKSKRNTAQVQPTTQKQSAQQIQCSSASYKDLKNIYSTAGYQYIPGDRYNPKAMWWASFLLPGLGQYITGSQIGLGTLQSVLAGASIPLMSATRYSYAYGYGYSYSSTSWAADIAVPAICVWLGTAIWSACSASKAAKIKNLYYRDLRNGVAYKFDVTPYFDMATSTLASNSNLVSGISLKLSF